MKFQQWPKRDPDKNYFKVPNEVFHIGLSYPEISIYCYLLSIEDRETYQCYPSYKTIGKALGMSENTVSKYVRSLEEKGLIRTEPTMVRSKDGRPLNGNLLYTIRPIQAAIELFYERQFQQLEEDATRQRAAARLAESARESPQNALCAHFGTEASPSANLGLEAQFGPLSEVPPRKKKQDKRRGRKRPLSEALLPAVRAVTGAFAGIGNGVKIRAVISSLRSQSPKAYSHKEKTGVNPGKENIMSKKEKFPLYLSPEKKAILERRYQEDGSRSITAFIERAVDFYLDYLSANNAGLFLPTSIKSYLDGRMGQLEERLSSMAFRQAVEQDMVAGILADAYQFSSEDLRRRRAESVQNVRKTNGRISLEQRVRDAWEEDDEWQD